jgi:hypothetical protein
MSVIFVEFGVGGLLRDQQLPFQCKFIPPATVLQGYFKAFQETRNRLTSQLPLDPLDPLAKPRLFPNLSGDLFAGVDDGAMITATEGLTNFHE